VTRRLLSLLVTLAFAACAGGGRELSPIQLVKVQTLGDTVGDGAIATTPLVSGPQRRGYRIVVPSVSAIASPPLLFGDGGSFRGVLEGDPAAGRSLGGAVFVRPGPGDSIWLFENSGHALIYDGTPRYVRTISLPSVAQDALILRDGRVLTTGDSSAIAQLYDAKGAPVRSFGARTADAGGRAPHYRVFAGTGGTFWTTTVDRRWQLEHWDTAGRLLGTLAPETSWFPSTAATSPSTAADAPPPPRIVAAWSDDSGRIWVAAEIADHHWKRGLGRGASGTASVIDDDKYYDSVVEVRDPKSGRVLASARFDLYCGSGAEPGMLVHEVVTSAGWQRAELLQVVWHAGDAW
jgi:hypothetical protein